MNVHMHFSVIFQKSMTLAQNEFDFKYEFRIYDLLVCMK